MRKLMMWLVLLISVPLLTGTVAKKEMPSTFYVYLDRGAKENHFIASGWMGDYGDLKLNPGYFLDASDKTKTCIKITYSAERKQSAGWAGIYWQTPANNWGDKKGGFNLSQYSKLAFKVKGDKGGEYIDKFIVGGITGQAEEGDSDNTETEPVELKPDWQEISIPLKGLDMNYIIGGFGFAINADMNEKGAAFYLDDIRFVK